MMRALAVLLLLLVLLGVYALMYAGWARSRRHHRSAASALDDAAPAALDDLDTVVAAEGIYVSTVTEHSRHERVTAGGLGGRARARMLVSSKVVRWDRDGGASVRVAASRITGVGLSAGMAGKFVGRPRMVALSWQAEDGSGFVTGFLPRHRADTAALLDAVRAATPSQPTVPEPITIPTKEDS